MRKTSILLILVLGLLISLASCQNDVKLTSKDFSESVKYRTSQEMVEHSLAAYNHLYPAKSRNSREVANIVPIRTNMSRSEVPNPLYAINFADSAGYVIVASHPNVEPIMAVIEKGTFDPNTDNDGFNAFLKAAENYIPTYSTNGLEINIDTLKEDFHFWEEDVDTILDFKVEPQVKNWWGQTGIYNKYCPVFYDNDNQIKNTPTGCVPTALGMVMATCKNKRSIDITYDGSEENMSLNWNELSLHSSTIYHSAFCTESNHDKIARLLRELGKRCNVVYGPQSSIVTNPTYIKKGLEAIGFTNIYPQEYTSVVAAIKKDKILLAYNPHHCFIIDGAKCTWYRYTERIYKEDPWGRRTLISTKVEDQQLYLAHVVWGYENNAVGYFNERYFNMLQPYYLDYGSVEIKYSPEGNTNYRKDLFYYGIEIPKRIQAIN